MLYARMKKGHEIHAPYGVDPNKWHRVIDSAMWFGSGHRAGVRFIDVDYYRFAKLEHVDVCIVAEKVNKVDNSLAELVEVEEVYSK